MSRKFQLNAPRLILAIILMLLGITFIIILSKVELVIGGKNLTSIAIILSGLIFYSGILVILAMFENETVLAIGLLTPSIIAVAIFVYGFIAWSARVSLSKWKGLTPDFTWVGLHQYINLFNHDQRFMIDVRNTAMFTVGFILGCMILGLSLAIF